MEQDAKWYVVYTYSGYENKVKDNIEKAAENRGMQDIIQQVIIPMETVPESELAGSPKKKGEDDAPVQRKLFPCYIFVKMIVTNESWYVVRNTRGVTGFVGPEGKPVPLTDAEVDRLRIEHKTVGFEVGDSVRIKNGSFEDYIGEVTEINAEKGIAKLSILYFGREMTAEVDFSDLERL